MRDRLFEMPPIAREVILPDDNVAEQRILDAVKLATPDEQQAGSCWYAEANLLSVNLAGKYPELGLTYEHVAGIIAVLSPLRSWAQNIEETIRILESNTAKTLGHAERSAKRIRAGEHPESVIYAKDRNNPKVRSFYHNIASPESSRHVTIDRHMWVLLFDDPDAVKNAGLYFKPSEYKWAEKRFHTVADRLGCMPHQLQAITWVRQRRIMGIGVPEPSTDHVQNQLDFN